MRVAFISDIHSNLPALQAVKEDIEQKDPDKIVCLGDVVGYNPWPSRCVELVQEMCDIVLQGNHDREVKNPESYKNNEMAYEGLKWSNEQLTGMQHQWLERLPEKKTVTFDGMTYVLVHSHPTELDAYVRPRDFPRMRPLLETDESGMFLGHTHIQHKAVIDGKTIVNPGSVGQPRDNDSRAAYAILDTERNEVDFCRVHYDIQEVLDAVNHIGLPEKTGLRLL